MATVYLARELKGEAEPNRAVPRRRLRSSRLHARSAAAPLCLFPPTAFAPPVSARTSPGSDFGGRFRATCSSCRSGRGSHATYANSGSPRNASADQQLANGDVGGWPIPLHAFTYPPKTTWRGSSANPLSTRTGSRRRSSSHAEDDLRCPISPAEKLWVIPRRRRNDVEFVLELQTSTAPRRPRGTALPGVVIITPSVTPEKKRGQASMPAPVRNCGSSQRTWTANRLPTRSSDYCAQTAYTVSVPPVATFPPAAWTTAIQVVLELG
jgi:hypothetical protein